MVFHTNAASKTDLVTQMTKRLREILYIERDKRALDEIGWYELKPDGSYGAVDGKHDDIYMSRGIVLKVSQLMDLPVEIRQSIKPPPGNVILSGSIHVKTPDRLTAGVSVVRAMVFSILVSAGQSQLVIYLYIRNIF